MNPSSAVNTTCAASTLDQQASLLGTVFLSVVNWFVRCQTGVVTPRGLWRASLPALPPLPPPWPPGLVWPSNTFRESDHAAAAAPPSQVRTRGEFLFSSHLCSSSSQLPSSRSFTWRRKSSSRRTSMWRKRRTTTMRRRTRHRPRRKG